MMRTPSIHHHKSYEDIPLSRGWIILAAALFGWLLFSGAVYGLRALILMAGGGA